MDPVEVAGSWRTVLMPVGDAEWWGASLGILVAAIHHPDLLRSQQSDIDPAEMAKNLKSELSELLAAASCAERRAPKETTNWSSRDTDSCAVRAGTSCSVPARSSGTSASAWRYSPRPFCHLQATRRRSRVAPRRMPRAHGLGPSERRRRPCELACFKKRSLNREFLIGRCWVISRRHALGAPT